MNPVTYAESGQAELQAILSASSAFIDAADSVRPHHPVTCDGDLRYDDGALACDHAETGPDDLRTRFCLHYSVSLLLIELVNEL